MRSILVMLICGGALFGQSFTFGPKQSIPPKATRYFHLAPIGQAKPDVVVVPDLRGPVQPCSIPLLNVLKGKTNDRITVPMPSPSNVDHMPFVNVPAPSCADVKK
jgi:hypothetical protein